MRQSLVRGSVFNVSIAQHQIRLSRLGAIGQRLKFVCSQDLIVWPHFYHYLALCQVVKGGAGAADPLGPARFSEVEDHPGCAILEDVGPDATQCKFGTDYNPC